MSLAAQKFLASVLDEAVAVHKRKKLAPVQQLRAEGYSLKEGKRTVLTSEDLAEALKEVRGREGEMARGGRGEHMLGRGGMGHGWAGRGKGFYSRQAERLC